LVTEDTFLKIRCPYKCEVRVDTKEDIITFPYFLHARAYYGEAKRAE